MIRLTRLNQTPFYLNSDLIEFIEVTPDTVITTTHGGKLLVAESAEEVVRRVTDYQREIHAYAVPWVRRPGQADGETTEDARP